MRRTLSELEPIWDMVAGALWVQRHRPTFRVFVWKGGEKVYVHAEQDAALLDTWLLQEGRLPTLASVQATIGERVEAGY